MSSIGRFVAFAIALMIAASIGWSAPAAAQETSGEYREALGGIHSEMNALTLEIENFRVSARYCKPPGIPSKAEVQAELDALASRAEALNRRYNALKQSLKDFARNPRVAAELMLRDIDPTQDRWFSSYEAARRRMLDALARKRAALAAAPEIDCRPKPKPKPAVTTGGGFQPPALPVRPSVAASGWPALPSHFCSWDERIKFFEQFDPVYLKASDDAVAAAKFRTEVEQAVNSYVQNDRPVPADLIARRRQAIADVEQAARKVQEAEDMRRRALAIPVIDCRKPQQEPPRQDRRTGQAPQQGLDPMDEFAIGRQQGEIEAVEKALADLREFARQGDCAKAWELAEELDEWLDELGPEPEISIRSGYMIPKPKLPPGQLEKWSRELDQIMDDCPDPNRIQLRQIYIPPPNSVDGRILGIHNKERALYRLLALQWDTQLAAGAMTYAQQLARTGVRVHAPREGRGAVRENLNQGMLGWSPSQMMQNWVRERQDFIPGKYPDVTRTGRWQDVSHYTQMIWPTTTKIGCGLASGSGYQWLVCRYSPGGNKDGMTVGLNPPVIANQGDIAPPNSSTPTMPRLDPRDMPRVGGGMTQIDPPPPPPPTARDDAPEGKEENHPLVRYAQAADAQHATETDCGNAAMARLELNKMRYALDELKKRLKAARQAGPFSSIKPDDVQRQIDDLERRIREAEQRKPRPRVVCPPPPPPPA